MLSLVCSICRDQQLCASGMLWAWIMDNYYQLVADTLGFQAAPSETEPRRGMNSAELNHADNAGSD